ncbi:hypothetical protein CALVIDRAFT_599436 [Calocera viscosa TUFC12733]|uniref:Uncharacterized protein n=1 Tax=Calocera viscosa (strain TUFC12733) TaxID=1330018 RepID=A0A167KSJ2_CALVF|nr:hypothetical protein CALVIDRAFT_599436 [Calocera viscosa TUFC12733]
MISTSPSSQQPFRHARTNSHSHSRLRTSKSAFSLEGLGFAPKLASSRTGTAARFSTSSSSAVLASSMGNRSAAGHGRVASLTAPTSHLPSAPSSAGSTGSNNNPSARSSMRFWRGKSLKGTLAPLERGWERGRAFSPELGGVEEGPGSPCSIIVIQPPSPPSPHPSTTSFLPSALEPMASRIRTRSMSPSERSSSSLEFDSGAQEGKNKKQRRRGIRDTQEEMYHPFANPHSSGEYRVSSGSSVSTASTSRPGDRRPSVSSTTSSASSASAYSQMDQMDADEARAYGLGLGLAFPPVPSRSTAGMKEKRMSLAPSLGSLGSAGSSRSGTPSLDLPSPRSSSVASYSPPTPDAHSAVFAESPGKRNGRNWDVPLELGGLPASDTARTITQSSRPVLTLSTRSSTSALTTAAAPASPMSARQSRTEFASLQTPKASQGRKLPSLATPAFALRPSNSSAGGTPGAGLRSSVSAHPASSTLPFPLSSTGSNPASASSAPPGSALPLPPVLSLRSTSSNPASASSATPSSTLPRSRTLTRSLSRKRSDSALAPAKAPPAGPLPSLPPVPKLPAFPSLAAGAAPKAPMLPSPNDSLIDDILERFPLPPGSKRFSSESDSSGRSELLTPDLSLDLSNLGAWSPVQLFSTDYAEPDLPTPVERRMREREKGATSVPLERMLSMSRKAAPGWMSATSERSGYFEDDVEEDEVGVHPFARSTLPYV